MMSCTRAPRARENRERMTGGVVLLHQHKVASCRSTAQRNCELFAGSYLYAVYNIYSIPSAQDSVITLHVCVNPLHNTCDLTNTTTRDHCDYTQSGSSESSKQPVYTVVTQCSDCCSYSDVYRYRPPPPSLPTSLTVNVPGSHLAGVMASEQAVGPTPAIPDPPMLFPSHYTHYFLAALPDCGLTLLIWR